MRQFWTGVVVGAGSVVLATVALGFAFLSRPVPMTFVVPPRALARGVAPVLAPLSSELVPALVAAVDRGIARRATLAVGVDGTRIMLPPKVVRALIEAVRPTLTRAILADLKNPHFDRRVLVPTISRAIRQEGTLSRPQTVLVPVHLWPGLTLLFRIKVKP